jgi:hypothetical protein
MTATMNPPELDLALKSLWGARERPFGAAVQTPYACDTFKQTRHRLEQLVSVRACGLLHGPNGVGKTLLVRHFPKSLPDKRYQPLVLSHSSVTGTDLLRLLGCDRRDPQPPFSLLLVGDEQLLARLQMGINAPLLARLSFCLRLEPWTADELAGYIQARLLNHLAQRASWRA